MALTVTYKVEIEFTAGTWTDITEYVESVMIRRGRNRELDRYSAGVATVRLNNSDRRFDPEYASGPYYANLKVRKRLRVGVVHSATTYYRFCGHIDGYPQSYEPKERAWVDITATDAFKLLATAELPSVWDQEVPVYRTAGGDPVALWARFDEQSGTVAIDSSTFGRNGVLEGGVSFSSLAGLPPFHGGTGLFFDGVNDRVLWSTLSLVSSPTVGLWVQMDTIDTADDQILLEYAATPGADKWQLFVLGTGRGVDVGKLGWGDNGSSAFLKSVVRVDDGRPHWVVSDNSPTGWPYIDGVESNGGSVTHGTTPVRYPGNVHTGFSVGAELVDGVTDVATRFKGTIDEVVLFPPVTSEATAAGFYAHGAKPWDGDTPKARLDRVLDYVGFAAADRDIDTGDAVLLPALLTNTSALAHMQLVEETEGGRLFVSRNGQVTLIGRRNFWEEASYRTSQATFNDPATGSQIPFSVKSRDVFDFSDEHLVNEVRVTQQGLTTVVVEDATSQTAHGLRTLSYTSAETSRASINAQAEWLLSRNKNPATRVNRVTIDPERNPSVLYPLVLGSDLGFRYTFVKNLSTGSAISKEVHLEEIAEVLLPGSYTITWGLAPGDPKVFLWSTAGNGWGDGVWGY